MFGIIREWLSRREALKVMANDRRLEREWSGTLFEATLERAESAVEADQHKYAITLWHEINERFHVEALKSKNILKMLLKMRAYDEAEQLMNQGRAAFRKDNFYLVGLARVAEQRGDAETALERWNLVRKQMPGLAEAYAGLCSCLVKLGRYDEAEQIIRRGVRRAPADTFCLMQWARLAEARGDLVEAAARWEHLRKSQDSMGHPTYQNGTIGLAGCLRRLGRFDEAAGLMQGFIEHIGLQEAPLAELARIAEDRADWANAIRHWERFKRSFPMNPGGYLGLIKAMRAAGESEQIEGVYVELLDRLPDTAWAAVEYANLAQDRGDLAESASRWKAVNERFPDNEEGYIKRAAALTALNQDEEAAKIKAECTRRFEKHAR